MIDSYRKISQKMHMNLFKKNIFLLIVVIIFADAGCAGNNTNQNFLLKTQSFLLPKHELTPEESSIELWATYYYLPQIIDGSGDTPLRDLEGKELGPLLSLKDWCNSALEGSVLILLNT